MAAAAATSSHLLLLLRSQPPPPPPSHSSSSSSSSSSLISSFLKPFLLSSTNALSVSSTTRLRQIHVPALRKPLFPSLFSTTTTTSSSSSLAFPPLAAVAGSSAHETIAEQEEDEEEEDWVDGELEHYDEETESEDDDLEAESGDLEDAQLGPTTSPLAVKREERLKLEVPNLSVKERKELASFAHSLGKKLKSQLVGKSGVTSNLATSFIETLEANELLKIKIHRTCPGELEDAVKQLEELTGSVTVSQIGRTLIIYKPSLTKLKAEEKKKQVQKLFLKRQYKPRVFNKSKEQPKSSRSIWRKRDSR